MTREWEEAVHRGLLDDLKQLAESGADINARNRHNQTALMLAATAGHKPVVEWLVRRGAALDHAAKYGLSALMLAVIGGHGEIVCVLVDAGADVTLRGSGAPGFAGLAALDLAVGRNDREMIDVLATAERRIGNPHFATAGSWDAAQALVAFVPRVPKATAGAGPPTLRVFVRDHRLRAVPIGERTLEADYGQFVFTQSHRTAEQAQFLALNVSYGPAPQEASILGRPARMYELGPAPTPEDVDGRSPAVISWHDGGAFYLLASGEMTADVLLTIAMSV
ncbi:MAG TPA: ankyrin repeat domain-containing protein [Vicinamibacterales bacterium]|nr:ankyrin repeat domain-containing protein [Vicinamibacterales bacterium]